MWITIDLALQLTCPTTSLPYPAKLPLSSAVEGVTSFRRDCHDRVSLADYELRTLGNGWGSSVIVNYERDSATHVRGVCVSRYRGE